MKRSRHCFKETFNNFDEMKPENSLNAPKGLASTQEASYDGRRSPWKQKNKDKPIWLENRATHYLGSAASKEVNHHLSLISKISHSNSTKLGKFLWNTQKKLGQSNFIPWPKTASRSSFRTKTQVWAWSFPGLGSYLLLLSASLAEVRCGLRGKLSTFGGLGPMAGCPSMSAFFLTRASSSGVRSLGESTNKMLEMSLMVQKSHSQPPGMYKNPCKDWEICHINWWAGFLNHQLYQVISSHI